MPPTLLMGRVALVTGAGSGIGRCASLVLAKNGATIIATDHHLENAEQTVKLLRSSESVAYHMDVSDSESINRVLDMSIDKYKRPPVVVVNCAGITRDDFILKMPESRFDGVIKVNLKGTFLVMQKFAQAMVDYRVHGAIVNCSSIVAKVGNMGQANYAASKAGIEAITRVAANEFGKHNIRVNCVVPGFTDTPFVAQVPEKVREMIIENCALKRLGQPEEVAEVIAFLASEKSSYVNGACLEVTGGIL